MRQTKWYFSRVNWQIRKQPEYNAVRIVAGQAIECNQPATKSETIARKRVADLNQIEHDKFMSKKPKLEVVVASGNG